MRKITFVAAAILTAISTAALAQLASPVGYLSAASTNSTLVKAGPGQVAGFVIVNTNATVYYFKFYDKATAPTCGTDTPKWRIPIPASTSGAGFAVSFPVTINFINGIGFCITSGIADNDTGNAATGITVNLGVK